MAMNPVHRVGHREFLCLHVVFPEVDREWSWGAQGLTTIVRPPPVDGIRTLSLSGRRPRGWRLRTGHRKGRRRELSLAASSTRHSPACPIIKGSSRLAKIRAENPLPGARGHHRIKIQIVMTVTGTPTLVGIPYDRASSHERGAAGAPSRIREALNSTATNDRSETGVDVGEHLGDAGNVSVPPDTNPRPLIENKVEEVLSDERRPLVLGGDHSITHPVLRAVRTHHPRLSVLQIDAHPDLYDTFDGDPYSHACPFSRILEEDLTDRLVQVGIRTMNPPQQKQAERFEVDVVPMQDWTDGTPVGFSRPVYVSIDGDALDPAFAPGVSHREPGGLSVRDVLGLLHSLDGPIVGGDVVEFNPERDFLGLTAPVCAKLVQEMVGQMVNLPASSSHGK